MNSDIRTSEYSTLLGIQISQPVYYILNIAKNTSSRKQPLHTFLQTLVTSVIIQKVSFS